MIELPETAGPSELFGTRSHRPESGAFRHRTLFDPGEETVNGRR